MKSGVVFFSFPSIPAVPAVWQVNLNTLSLALALIFCKPTDSILFKRGVALTGRNTTGPPCSVGDPISTRPAADRPRARRPAGPYAGSVTDDDR